MRRDVMTDWTVRDDVRAKLRSQVKRLLVKHKYLPDKQPGAIPAGHVVRGRELRRAGDHGPAFRRLASVA